MAIVAPRPAAAQGFIARAGSSHTVYVDFSSPVSGESGYTSARAPVEYQFYACRGNSPGGIFISWNLRPDGVQSSGTYRYEGDEYPAPPRPSVSTVRFTGPVQSGAGVWVGNMERDADPGSFTADCETPGINYHRIADLTTYVADVKDLDAVAQFLNTLRVRVQPTTATLRDYDLERSLAQDLRSREEAERAREEAEAARQQETERQQQAEAERQQQAEAERMAASSQSQSQASAQAEAASAQESEAAREARFEAEAEEQRQADAEHARIVEQELARRAAEEERQRQEQEQATEDAVMTTANLAMQTGGFFGGYYFAADVGVTQFDTMEEMTGLGGGVNWRFFYVEGGMVTGTYGDEYRAEYSDTHGSELDAAASGMFIQSGLALDFPMGESGSIGASGGYMYAFTEEFEMGSPVLGLIARIGMLKGRLDFGLGETSFVGGGIYLNLGG